MIQQVHTTLLLPNELVTLVNRLIAIIEKALANIPFIQKVIKLVKDDLVDLEKTLTKDLSSEYTQQLLDRDNLRDSAFLGLRDFVRANTHRINLEIVKAAEMVYNIIKKHGTALYKMGYIQQSAKLKLLFNELNEPLVQQALATIQAASWYEELKSTQAEFEQMYAEKITDATKKDYPQLYDAKAKLGRDLSVLLDAISVVEKIDDEPDVTTIVHQINEVITDVMTQARARRTRATKE
jgi:hypothetical protein